MNCDYLKVFKLPEASWSVASCEAYYQPYSPTIAEMQNFCCNKDNSDKCPMYCEKHLKEYIGQHSLNIV